jgi:putative membrane protein
MALRILSGNTFNSQYLKRVGISVHQRTIELLQQAQDSATDPDLKAMAAQMLPTVQGHLRMARHISVQMGSNPSTSQ